MHEFWDDYVKPKHGKKQNFFYMATDSFIVYIKAKDVYIYTTKEVKTRFYISNYGLERTLPKKLKNVLD